MELGLEPGEYFCLTQGISDDEGLKEVKKEKRPIWTKKEVSVLLEIMIEKKIVDLLHEKKYKRVNIYKLLRAYLEKRGFVRTTIQVMNKWKQLKSSYYDAKKAGGESEDKIVKCPNYFVLEELLGSRPVLAQALEGKDSVSTPTQQRSSSTSAQCSSSSAVPDDTSDQVKVKRMKKEKNIKKRPIWSEEEVSALLEIMKEKNVLGLFHGKKYHKTDIYKLIRAYLRMRGFVRTSIQISTKWKHLKASYIEMKKSNGENKGNRLKYPHFLELQELLESTPAETFEETDHTYEADDLGEEVRLKEKRPIWSEEEVSVLLEIMKENDILGLLDEKKYKKQYVYSIVTEQLENRGFVRSTVQVITKWKHLKALYAEAMRANGNPTKCPHFLELQELLGSRLSSTLEETDANITADLSRVETLVEVDEVISEVELIDFTQNLPNLPTVNTRSPPLRKKKRTAGKPPKPVKKKSSLSLDFTIFLQDWEETARRIAREEREEQQKFLEKILQQQNEMLQNQHSAFLSELKEIFKDFKNK